jgi:hypothetical protein
LVLQVCMVKNPVKKGARSAFKRLLIGLLIVIEQDCVGCHFIRKIDTEKTR